MASRKRTRPLDGKMRGNIGDHLFRYQEQLQIQSLTEPFVLKVAIIVVVWSHPKEIIFWRETRVFDPFSCTPQCVYNKKPEA